MTENFYLIEETIHLMQILKKNLRMNEFDMRLVHDPAVFSKIDSLIRNLDTLLTAKERDPRMLKLFTEVDGLREFVVSLNEILGSVEVRQDWLARINNVIEHIIAGLDDWLIIATEKMRAHQQGKFTNSYLEHLPLSNSANYFYVYVKELNPQQTRHVHPFNQEQLRRQQERTTQDLLQQDPVDPVTGYRQYGQGDNQTFPGSQIRITQGHHRTFELYRRFIQGKLDGNTLLLVKRQF